MRVTLLALFVLGGCQDVNPANLGNGLAAVAEETTIATSADYARVDASFSEIAIDTVIEEVRGRLVVIATEDCFETNECEWHDANRVRHYFWTDGHDEPWLVVKSVRAEEVGNSPIAALGIGDARSKDDVLKRVHAFAPSIELACTAEHAGIRCGGTVLPGWIRIWFDRNGILTEVRFDGYHFI